MTIIHIGGITWQDGQLSGDGHQLTELQAFLGVLADGEKLPVFGNGPWVEPNMADPFGFLAVAQAALGVHEWASDGLEYPPFAMNPSDQDDVIA